MRVIFAGGVTGGHIAPGVALAEKILADVPGSEVLFASVANGTEQRMIADRGLPLVKITERNRWPGAVAMHAPASWLRSLRLLRSFRADIVVGLGGGASLGTGVAAIMNRTPLFLIEQNVIPGQANRLMSRWAAQICCQWPQAVDRIAGRAVYTGGLVRSEILAVRGAGKKQPRTFFGLSPDVPTLLVMGGSQGASPINRVLVDAAPALAGRVQLIHLAGAADAPNLSEAYKAAGLAAHVTSFLETMHLAYAAADLALSRSGAMSLAELASVGVPAVLVPLPNSKDDHQRANAQAAVEQKWAMIVEQGELSGDVLATVVETLLHHESQLETMRQNALASVPGDAADGIVQAMLQAAPGAHAVVP